VLSVATLFDELAAEILPEDVEVFHLGDDMLAKVVVKQGGLSPFLYRRLAEHVTAAEQAGMDAVQVTCSSISPCVDSARALVDIPVLKIDEAMVDAALSLGQRIGIAATAATALKPTADLVALRAAETGQHVDIEPAWCEGAYEALFAGDHLEHDRIVQQTIKELAARNDVVLLAQGSMVRAIASMPSEEQQVPVLTSPRLALGRLRDQLRNMEDQ
jgi:Asp/Glu/hydantoin racemase